jgi:tRNA-modifying protein YgfZ
MISVDPSDPSSMPHARLPDRATLLVTGTEAEPFLQNLVTADLASLSDAEARPSALLTPQGKILFDFLVSRIEGGLRLDVAAGARGDLAKRLTLYKLRAKVTIAPSDEPVVAVWDEAAPSEGAFADRRFPARVFRRYEEIAAGDGDPSDFEALRLSLGIAEAERDFPGSDVFPHDVLLDQNEGVSFRKGCFVGQEVVSRMQHRGTARRRVMVLRAEGHLTPGSNLEAGGKAIGTVLSAVESLGIGMVRIDRLVDALSAGEELSADGVPVEAEVPSWAGYALPQPGAGGEA